VAAGAAMVDAIMHNPSAAAAQLGPYLQLYKDLQEKIEGTSDQLSKSATDAEASAHAKAARTTRAMFTIGGISLFMLLLGDLTLVRGISGSLHRLTQMIQNIAEGEGDVSKRLQIAKGFERDEMGEVSRLFNLFMDKLQDILRGVAAHTQ